VVAITTMGLRLSIRLEQSQVGVRRTDRTQGIQGFSLASDRVLLSLAVLKPWFLHAAALSSRYSVDNQ
jgi:hypothetical protein